MLRYLAAIWNETDHSKSDAAQVLTLRARTHLPAWRVLFDAPGIRVWCTSADRAGLGAQRLHDNAGVVIGTLFERESADDAVTARKVYRRADPDATASTHIIASAGRALVRNYWGRYVAFLFDSATGRRWILRDPMGGIPCFSTEFEGITLYCASLEDCCRLGIDRFSINWDFVATNLAAGPVCSRQTALKEVTEVVRGECIAVDGNRVTGQLYWHPFEFLTAAQLIEDPVPAITALRRTARACIEAWGSLYEHVLLRLSGGLDSAIVLTCLRHAAKRPAVTGLNYYSDSFEGDEREYARIAAQHAGCPLVERNWNNRVRLDGSLDMVRSPKPTMYWGWLQHARSETDLAKEIGAGALLGGEGGDQLLHQAHPELAAADYVRRHGPDTTFFKTALDAAHLSRRSIWAVLRVAAVHGALGRRPDFHAALKDVESVIEPQAHERAQQTADRWHPWFTNTGGIPPGKLWQSYAISAPLVTFNPLDETDPLDRIEPLTFSQPLVELAFRIVTDILTRHGCDRFAARQAFGAALPPEIFNRYSKGGPRDGVKELLAQNHEFVRALLLDGLLVQHGVISGQRLQHALSAQPTRIQFIGMEILKLLSTEAWLRRWSESRQRAAA